MYLKGSAALEQPNEGREEAVCKVKASWEHENYNCQKDQTLISGALYGYIGTFWPLPDFQTVAYATLKLTVETENVESNCSLFCWIVWQKYMELK